MLKWGVVLLVIVALFVISSISRAIYTDLLWYDALGFQSVYTKVLFTKVIMFLVGAIIFAVLVSVSLWFGFKQTKGEVTLPLPPEVVSLLGKAVGFGAIAVGAILSIIFGVVFSSNGRFSSDSPTHPNSLWSTRFIINRFRFSSSTSRY